MAIAFLDVKNMATDIVTLGYRSPELLLGATAYDHSIDIWSVGCIFAELANDGIPIFSSATIDGQLKQIFCVLGLPNKSEWPDFETLPKASEFIRKPVKKIPIKCIEKRLDPLGTKLLHVKGILF
uniref:Cyclin-dependent-like kinase 5 (Trinotate prediction) n=1 Tax=Myxobolus squamalis TaxID=59785 RepID=A0A6B2G9L2_MYXSQ